MSARPDDDKAQRTITVETGNILRRGPSPDTTAKNYRA